MKKLLCNAAVSFGVDAVIRECNRHPRIVFWHGVDYNVNPLVEAEMVEFSNFQKQIEYINKHYEIISISEMTERIKRKMYSGKEIVLSFDDGYRNNLTVVAPYLKTLNLPFTVYVSTHHIETGEIFPTSLARLIVWGSELKNIELPSIQVSASLDTVEEKTQLAKKLSNILKTRPLIEVKALYSDLRNSLSSLQFNCLYEKHSTLMPMSWDEVKSLHDNFDCTIGAHCIDHLCCHANQNMDDVHGQIIQSKSIIESKLGVKCTQFAYPNGSLTDESNKIVLDAGFEMGVSTKLTKIELASTMAAIPRICLPSDVNMAKLKLNINPR